MFLCIQYCNRGNEVLFIYYYYYYLLFLFIAFITNSNYKTGRFSNMELSKPLCHSSQSAIVTTSIFYSKTAVITTFTVFSKLKCFTQISGIKNRNF